MATQRVYDGMQEVYTDKVEDVGAVRRVYFYFLARYAFVDTETGNRVPGNEYEWRYYGTTSAQKPPPSYPLAPIVEHTYIQFPTDFSYVDDMEQELYNLAFKAGPHKDGLT